MRMRNSVVKMKQEPNYGFPLSHLFFRILFILIILLTLSTLIITDLNPYLLIFITFFVIIIYVFFGMIHFKKQFLSNRKNLLEKIIKTANLKGDEYVLDLGTGSGFLAIGFAKNLKNGKSFGLDKFSLKNETIKEKIISTIKINFVGNSLKNAKMNAKIENVENKCEFIQADITKPLDFANEYFNLIVSSQLIYCIEKQKRISIFNEINRVLKKEGKIIFFESKSFMGWDINEVKNFFEEKRYTINVTPAKKFKKCVILIGQKTG